MDMSLPKPIQEVLAEGSNELPEQYIYKGGNGTSDIPFLHLEVPLVDFSLLVSTSSDTRVAQLGKLRSALSSYGCFQLINHGMADSLLDKLDKVSRQFFALPAEEKQKYSRELHDFEGYGNDTVLSQNQVLDWNDRLYLTVSPPEHRKLGFWPEKPENFREVLDAYTAKVVVIVEVILKAMAKSLNIEEDSFWNQYKDGGEMTARFNLYPACPRPDLTLGTKAHADGSALTLLLPDKEVEGLQLVKDDQWYTVPIVPYALLINVGDYTEVMSNGIFKSPVHRVITNSARQRNSLAMFCNMDQNREIKVIEELVGDGRPRLYKNLKDYVSIFFQSYQLGKRPIDALKI